MIRMAKLARWLGPWADATRAPLVHTLTDHVGELRYRVYAPDPRMRGKREFFIAPGLHYEGPDDPRMDRFCRILAAAGNIVVAPFIPDYENLRPAATSIEAFAEVFNAVPTRAGKRIVFSISFGSLLAFALAANQPDDVERLVIFGGYADFHETMRFCLTGHVTSGRNAQRDPLNQPAVLMNLLSLIEHDVTASGHLTDGWFRYMRRTWGRPEMKVRERFVAIADELAPNVPESVRELFLVGIGALPGAWDLAGPALERFDATALDPRPYLPRIRCRVDLVHGVDDDVIPFEQSHALAALLVHASSVRVHVTGLYGHTGAQRPPLGALAKELATMIRVLRALAM